MAKDKRTEENRGIEIGTSVVYSLRYRCYRDYNLIVYPNCPVDFAIVSGNNSAAYIEQVNKGSATLIDMLERWNAYPHSFK